MGLAARPIVKTIDAIAVELITTFARFKCVVQKWGKPLLIDTEGPLMYSSVSFEFARMKELSIFGFIGFKQMNRTCDFWATILWMYIKRIQQWGLITVLQVPILLFFEAWCSRKKSPRVSISFHLKTFRSKVTKVIIIGLLFRCVLQAWE